MAENSDKINELLVKLEYLTQKQENLSVEVNELRSAIHSIKKTSNETLETTTQTASITERAPIKTVVPSKVEQKVSPSIASEKPKEKKLSIDIEKFIGENLANKIGIAITILGVGIGAKYAIDHQLISPLTRIILGYLVGLGLLGFALKLKKNYENFSSVLLSGAMAILYFLSFAAYSFYHLIPNTLAFALMVLFTGFTVVSALSYNRQIIAQIGLVGAYAVPFLLSNNSGNASILFVYMSIINAGILIIAFKKYWKVLYYLAFGLTWIIFLSWFTFSYRETEHFNVALVFSIVFFVLFYCTALSIKLIQKEQFRASDVIMLLLNSFVFYGIGLALLNDVTHGEELTGLFTVSNAVIHFLVCLLIYKTQKDERKFFYLVGGLVLTFITLAIPIQLDGNWVTLIWASEAVLLYWIGRTKQELAYEKMAFPLMWLAFFSILHDWTAYNGFFSWYNHKPIIPLVNIHFFTTLFVAGAFAFMTQLNRSKIHPIPSSLNKGFFLFLSYLIPGLLFTVLYLGIQMEIGGYFQQEYYASKIELKEAPSYYYSNVIYNQDFLRFKGIWQLIFSLLYFSGLLVLFKKKSKNRYFDLVPLGLLVLTIFLFLSAGLIEINNLRISYSEQKWSAYYTTGFMHLLIRYLAITALSVSLYIIYKFVKKTYEDPQVRVLFDLSLHVVIIWLASSELIQWLELANSSATYKLGLSILWGTYALYMVSYGIWKKQRHMRLGAIVLFGITLVKLFLYDIAQLNTIAKTVVFLSLGVLLLVISFLYNKYKHLIADENIN
jgi:uncharacterized membrane protein